MDNEEVRNRVMALIQKHIKESERAQKDTNPERYEYDKNRYIDDLRFKWTQEDIAYVLKDILNTLADSTLPFNLFCDRAILLINNKVDSYPDFIEHENIETNGTDYIRTLIEQGETTNIVVELENLKQEIEQIFEDEKIKTAQVKTIDFGDYVKIRVPDMEIDSSRVADFGEDCWNLVKKYAAALGIEIISNYKDDDPTGYDIAGEIHELILNDFFDAGVKIKF